MDPHSSPHITPNSATVFNFFSLRSLLNRGRLYNPFVNSGFYFIFRSLSYLSSILFGGIMVPNIE